MDYNTAREYISKAYERGSVYGLEAVTALMDALDRPDRDVKIIHLAGTNGKGSVGAFIARVLMEAGYRVGRYVSPTVYAYEERFQINGENISKDRFAKIMTRVAEATTTLDCSPTGFELETGVVFLYFKEEKCDLALIECGLGGREDATNVIESSLLTVITSIGLDHTALLGDTIEKIAYEKAGIIKPDGRVVTCRQEPSVLKVIEDACSSNKAVLTVAGEPDNKRISHFSQYFDYGDIKDIEINMPGAYQYDNAVLALEGIKALRELGYTIDDLSLRKGMKNARWKGRFDIISHKPVVVLDGAHNPQGAVALRHSLEMYFKGSNLQFITGVFKDKDYEGIAGATADMADIIYTIKPPSDRGLDPVILADTMKKYNADADVKAMELKVAVDECLSRDDYITVVFGSLSFLGEVSQYIREKQGV